MSKGSEYFSKALYLKEETFKLTFFREKVCVSSHSHFPTVCVVTTEAGTCLTVAVAAPSDRGEAEAPGATVIPLAPATTLAAMVTMLAHVDAVSGLLPLAVVMVMV